MNELRNIAKFLRVWLEKGKEDIDFSDGDIKVYQH